MAQEIVQHGHCHVCGRVVTYGETACSEKCKEDWEKTRRSRKRSMMLMYIMMGVFVLFFLVLPLLGIGGGG